MVQYRIEIIFKLERTQMVSNRAIAYSRNATVAYN